MFLGTFVRYFNLMNLKLYVQSFFKSNPFAGGLKPHRVSPILVSPFSCFFPKTLPTNPWSIPHILISEDSLHDHLGVCSKDFPRFVNWILDFPHTKTGELQTPGLGHAGALYRARPSTLGCCRRGQGWCYHLATFSKGFFLRPSKQNPQIKNTSKQTMTII